MTLLTAESLAQFGMDESIRLMKENRKLLAENKRLRKALERIAEFDKYEPAGPAAATAKAALKETEE